MLFRSGLIAALKQDYEALSRDWEHQKHLYETLTDTHEKLKARSQLNQTHGQLKTTILKMLYTPNYRPKKIRPESEQRHLSRSIKDFESTIVQHWGRLMTLVQVLVFQRMMMEMVEKNDALKAELPPLIDLQPTAEALARIKACKQVQRHALFEEISDLDNNLQYCLETWRGDMDGNPYVNDMTMGLSMAYGRKRGFERLSADEAVVHYRLPTADFEQLELEMKARLSCLLTKSKPAWQAYIQERQKAGWQPIQIYSGLAYFRMVELTEAAEQFLRKKIGRAHV